MKSLTTAMLLIFLVLAFSGCDKDVEKTRTLYLPAEVYYYNFSSGQLTKKVVYEYDEKDFLKEIKTYTYLNGIETLDDTDTVTCDKDGNIVAFRDNVGKMESLFSSVPSYATNYTYCYNEAGQVIERKTLYAERTTTEQWNYDDQGRLLGYMTLHPGGILHESHFFYDDQGKLTTIRNYEMAGFVSMTLCEYNEAGEMAEYRTFLANGKLYEHYSYSYEGNAVTKHREVVKGGVSTYFSDTEVCAYDQAGNLISRANSKNQKPTVKYTYRAIEVSADSPRYETDPYQIGQTPIPGVYDRNAVSISGRGEKTRTIYVPEREVRYYSKSGATLPDYRDELRYVYDDQELLTSIMTTHIDKNGRKRLKDTDTVVCDELGRIITWVDVPYNPNNTLSTFTYQYTYNETGLLKKKETYGGLYGRAHRYTEYWEYNDLGQPSKYTRKNTDNSWSQCDYSYNPQGNLVEIKEYIDGSLKYITTCTYNSKNQRTLATTKYGDGDYLSSVSYIYAENTVKVAYSHNQQYAESAEKIYTFDKVGNLISIESPGENCYKIEYTYRAVEISENSPRYYVNPQNIGVLPQDEVRP